jgi:hypothetical protein
MNNNASNKRAHDGDLISPKLRGAQTAQALAKKGCMVGALKSQKRAARRPRNTQ